MHLQCRRKISVNHSDVEFGRYLRYGTCIPGPYLCLTEDPCLV